MPILQQPHWSHRAEAGRYNWNHIKVSQANQGSGTAVKQLEAPKGPGQTRCSAPGEHTGLSLQRRGRAMAREAKGRPSSLSAPRDCTHLWGEGIKRSLCQRNTWIFYTLFITPTGAHLVMEMTIHIALETPAGFHLGQAVGELAGQVCSIPSGARYSLLFTKSPSPSGMATCAQVCECKTDILPEDAPTWEPLSLQLPALAHAQEVPKAFGGAEHLPRLGFNRSHRYKKV